MSTRVPHAPTSRSPSDMFRHYVGDVVYGANDGIVTTFSIVSGVSGAELAPAIIVILGFVNLLADGFSMGASNFLSIRSMAAAEGKDRGVYEPILHATTTFGAFLVGGVLPLLAYLLPIPRSYAFPASCGTAALGLFVVGASRSLVGHRSGLRAGLETLAVGSIAALVAYGAGALLASWVSRP